jgi:hypothetical protein
MLSLRKEVLKKTTGGEEDRSRKRLVSFCCAPRLSKDQQGTFQYFPRSSLMDTHLSAPSTRLQTAYRHKLHVLFTNIVLSYRNMEDTQQRPNE